MFALRVAAAARQWPPVKLLVHAGTLADRHKEGPALIILGALDLAAAGLSIGQPWLLLCVMHACVCLLSGSICLLTCVCICPQWVMCAVFKMPPELPSGKVKSSTLTEGAMEVGTLAMLPHDGGLQNGHSSAHGDANGYLTGSAAPVWLEAERGLGVDGHLHSSMLDRMEGPAKPPRSPFQTWGSGVKL